MIERKVNVLCVLCGQKSKLGKWNDNTYSECTTKEMKKLFLPLTDERAFNREYNSFYKCPVCNKWLRGSQLVITDTNNRKLLRLGREPVFSMGELDKSENDN